MKEVRAYIRAAMASNVAGALARSGYTFSLLDVRGFAAGLARSDQEYSITLGSEYEKVFKLELICDDDHTEAVIALIAHAAATGKRGDGMIFVGPIDDAVRIRNGKRGELALRDE